MKSFNRYITEELSTKEISVDEFPNPLRGRIKDILKRRENLMVKRVMMLSNPTTIFSSEKSQAISVGNLPRQSPRHGSRRRKGGNLGSIVSKDGHILDGHHRYAATLFADPNAKIIGIEADLESVILCLCFVRYDAYGNKRRGEPTGGDLNIYDATIDDALAAIYSGNMNPKFYSREKAEGWLESIGGEELEKRLKLIQSKRPLWAHPA